jgi:hypothetical protein
MNQLAQASKIDRDIGTLILILDYRSMALSKKRDVGSILAGSIKHFCRGRGFIINTFLF